MYEKKLEHGEKSMSQREKTFYHLGIAPEMLQILEKMKFAVPTPIQHQAIPVALEGKDIMGVAQTGTGKTMAFGIPIVQRLAAEGGQALILVPTRELAMQVKQALMPFLRAFQMKTAVLIGGVKMTGQIADVKRGPDIIIATPGRLNDFIYQAMIDLGNVHVVVLDEADRMFDMGFEPQVKSILRCLTNKKQTMLFSATMPQNIMNLATKHMTLPIRVEIAPSGTTIKEVSQELFIVKEELKDSVIQMLLQAYRGSVLIFTRTKVKASRVMQKVRAMGVKVAEIHSNRSMGQRKQAIEGFKRGRYRVLVATDIAARGIDISMIELVVNYDLPDDVENYVHRIGRTGRAGREGHAVTLATPTQSRDVQKIERLIKMTIQRSRHPEFAHAEFHDDKAPSSKSKSKNRRFSRTRPGTQKSRFKGKSTSSSSNKNTGTHGFRRKKAKPSSQKNKRSPFYKK